MKRLALNLPAIAALAIIIVFSVDLPVLRALKTESTFGLWIAVPVPVAAMLAIAQIILWIALPRSRPLQRVS